MEYDVFISCKSEDYKYAEEIYNFLNENDIHAFLANKELRQMADSEYRRAISQALKTSYHLIVFASKAEYIDSTWVYYEWDWFLVAMIKKKKKGQILSILKDISIDDVNADLWKYESQSFDSYKDNLIPYVETPSSLKRKDEARQKALLEAERLKKEKEAQKLRDSIKLEIQESSTEYHRHSSNLDSYAQQIIEKQKQIGIIEKGCPVCKSLLAIESKYCAKCGWTFNPIFDVNPSGDERHLFIMRGIWKSVKEADVTKEKITILENTIKEKESKILLLQDELKKNLALIKELDKVKCERDDLQIIVLKLKSQLSSIAENLSLKEMEIKEIQKSSETDKDELCKLIQKLETKDKQVESLISNLNESQDKLAQIRIELKVCRDNELSETERRIEVENELLSLRNRIKSRNTSFDDEQKGSVERDRNESAIPPQTPDVVNVPAIINSDMTERTQTQLKKNERLYFASKDDIKKLILEYCGNKSTNSGMKLVDMDLDFNSFLKDLKAFYGFSILRSRIKGFSFGQLVEFIWQLRNESSMSRFMPRF